MNFSIFFIFPPWCTIILSYIGNWSHDRTYLVISRLDRNNMLEIPGCTYIYENTISLLQVTLHVANGHSFVNAMLFLVLHRGLRQAAADACCTSMSTMVRWLTAGWSPEPYTLDASVPGASPEPVLAAPPPPPPTSLPAYTIRHTSMRVRNNDCSAHARPPDPYLVATSFFGRQNV